MMLASLRHEVREANLRLVREGLVTLTWGNVSGRSDDGTLVVIKPSGVAYETLRDEDLVVLNLDGDIVEGTLRPSSDTPTHLHLYRSFAIGGIAHTHSRCAVAFAQARREIPCLGTTHADHFHGAVPLTRVLRADEVQENYESNTGKVIVERFDRVGAPDPLAVPGVLVAGHGPFTWGANVGEATDNAIALEAVAGTAIDTLALAPDAHPLERWILDKHHARKHGAAAYYGQRGDGDER